MQSQDEEWRNNLEGRVSWIEWSLYCFIIKSKSFSFELYFLRTDAWRPLLYLELIHNDVTYSHGRHDTSHSFVYCDSFLKLVLYMTHSCHVKTIHFSITWLLCLMWHIGYTTHRGHKTMQLIPIEQTLFGPCGLVPITAQANPIETWLRWYYWWSQLNWPRWTLSSSDAMDNINVPLYHVRCYPSENISSSRGLIHQSNILNMLEAML